MPFQHFEAHGCCIDILFYDFCTNFIEFHDDGLKTSTLKPNSNMEIMFYGFQGLLKHIPLSFKGNGLDFIGSDIIYLII
jgi:hypothetical protein